jgi:predicted acetyltransferase
MSFEVRDHFDEIFDIEMEGWCHGITCYPGEIFPGLVHAVIKELQPSFKRALEYNYVFNVHKLAAKFAKAAKYMVPEKEIAFSIIAQMPNPVILTEEEQFVMAQIIDQVEQQYGGALERLRRKWAHEKKFKLKEKKEAA